jgi:hypothetical protein
VNLLKATNVKKANLIVPPLLFDSSRFEPRERIHHQLLVELLRLLNETKSKKIGTR